jgi:KaiC/GvpD/RAD55 family RecA-like ATPase
VIDLKLEEAEEQLARFLRIYSLKGAKHSTQWYPFEITENGIQIGTKDERAGLSDRHRELHFPRFT